MVSCGSSAQSLGPALSDGMTPAATAGAHRWPATCKSAVSCCPRLRRF